MVAQEASPGRALDARVFVFSGKRYRVFGQAESCYRASWRHASPRAARGPESENLLLLDLENNRSGVDLARAGVDVAVESVEEGASAARRRRRSWPTARAAGRAARGAAAPGAPPKRPAAFRGRNRTTPGANKPGAPKTRADEQADERAGGQARLPRRTATGGAETARGRAGASPRQGRGSEREALFRGPGGARRGRAEAERSPRRRARGGAMPRPSEAA